MSLFFFTFFTPNACCMIIDVNPLLPPVALFSPPPATPCGLVPSSTCHSLWPCSLQLTPSCSAYFLIFMSPRPPSCYTQATVTVTGSGSGCANGAASAAAVSRAVASAVAEAFANATNGCAAATTYVKADALAQVRRFTHQGLQSPC